MINGSLLILATTDVARDARVHRQINALQPDWQITCAAVGQPSVDCEFIEIEMHRLQGWNPIRNRSVRAYERCLLEMGQFDHFYWRQRWARETTKKLSSRTWDVIIANDLDTLPVAIEIAGDTPVVFDAHEYYPGQHPTTTRKQKLQSQYSTFLCQKYGPKAQSMMTVCNGISEKYLELIGMQATVVENCPAYADLEPQVHGEDKIRLIHHGACRANRGIDQLIRMMDLLDDCFALNLILTGDRSRSDFQTLANLAQGRNITFSDPVGVEEIPHAISHHDIGVYILPPDSENHRLALPNKFFDFIQGRLGIAIGPSPEMARIVNEHDLGIVADGFTPESLAKKLNAMTLEDIHRFKSNSDQVAKHYSTKRTNKLLCDIVSSVCPQQSARGKK